MIVKQEIARQVLSGKRSMIRVPRNGSRCPYRENHAYIIQTARGAPPSCHITILSVGEAMFEDAPVWVIRFKKGDHTDKDRFPAARVGGSGGDYTDSQLRALNGTRPEVPEFCQAKYAREAEAKHVEKLADAAERLSTALGEIKGYVPAGKARKELTWAEKRIAAVLAQICS